MEKTKNLIVVFIGLIISTMALAEQDGGERISKLTKDGVAFDATILSDTDTIPSNGIYKSWSQTVTHQVIDSIPDSFNINLDGFSMPVKNRFVTSRFGYRPRFKREHKGVDLRAAVGDTVFAAFDGKVRIARYNHNGYGNYVVIRHNNGMETIYGHLSIYFVSPNDNVKSGQAIGLAGNTGRSTGPHLHFETRFCGRALNPQDLIHFEEGRSLHNEFCFKQK